MRSRLSASCIGYFICVIVCIDISMTAPRWRRLHPEKASQSISITYGYAPQASTQKVSKRGSARVARGVPQAYKARTVFSGRELRLTKVVSQRSPAAQELIHADKEAAVRDRAA